MNKKEEAINDFFHETFTQSEYFFDRYLEFLDGDYYHIVRLIYDLECLVELHEEDLKELKEIAEIGD